MSFTHNKNWHDRARAILPGGTFGNMGADTLIARGDGAYVWDTDGNKYIDYLIGSGPMLIGHNPPEVVEAVKEQLSNGTTFFATSPPGIELGEVICDAMACAEKIRYVSTGGEADMYAMRLARAYTGRDKIVKFEGGYHGMSAEAQMSMFPTRNLNFPMAEPDSAGIGQDVQDNVLVAPYNDPAFVSSLLAEQGSDVAAILVEPLQRIIPPEPGFLEHLRAECDKHGILLIFDEVVTGFRFAWGGAQEKYGVTPDLCTLGKIVGGGYALAAIAGRADIMDLFDKSVGEDRWLMQIGTLSGNPVASVAGLKTLEILSRDGQYDKLRAIGKTLWDALTEALTEQGIAHTILGDLTLFDVVFADGHLRDYREVRGANADHLSKFNAGLHKRGLFKSTTKIYVHLALSDIDIDQTCEAFRAAAAEL